MTNPRLRIMSDEHQILDVAQFKEENVSFVYTNHKGNVSERLVSVQGLEYGSVKDYYDEPQWLLKCFDHHKGQTRTFALARIDMTTFKHVS